MAGRTLRWLLALALSVATALVVVLALAGTTPSELLAEVGRDPDPPVVFTLDLEGNAGTISPGVYGVAAAPQEVLRSLNASLHRWGGNTASRYNWEAGNVWNVGRDWYFENQKVEDDAWRVFLAQTLETQAQAVLTIPLIGYVAKDAESVGFSVAKYGPQQKVDPYNPDAGNGVRKDGEPVTGNDPADTSIEAGPEFMRGWIAAIRRRFPKALSEGRIGFALDNEPMLWNVTHRDVHPDPVSYREYLNRFVAMATVIRTEAPNAPIIGPELWGWPAYFESALDRESDGTPDRERHGGTAFLPWFLGELKDHEDRTGTRLIDVVSVHYYPQAKGVFDGDLSAGTCRNRIHAPRSLADPEYLAPSWIGDRVRLIPRLREWVAERYPGLDVAVTEYNWGAEDHISGALAVASALGIFGAEGVRMAAYWQHPRAGSPAHAAFSMFTNVDGQGNGFGTVRVPASRHHARRARDTDVALYAARTPAPEPVLTVIALNRTAVDKPVGLRTKNGRIAGLKEGFRLSTSADGIESYEPTLQKREDGLFFRLQGLSIVHLRFAVVL